MNNVILTVCISFMGVLSVLAICLFAYWLWYFIWCKKENKRINNEYRETLYKKLNSLLDDKDIMFSYDEFIKYREFKKMDKYRKEK